MFMKNLNESSRKIEMQKFILMYEKLLFKTFMVIENSFDIIFVSVSFEKFI